MQCRGQGQGQGLRQRIAVHALFDGIPRKEGAKALLIDLPIMEQCGAGAQKTEIVQSHYHWHTTKPSGPNHSWSCRRKKIMDMQDIRPIAANFPYNAQKGDWIKKGKESSQNFLPAMEEIIVAKLQRPDI